MNWKRKLLLTFCALLIIPVESVEIAMPFLANQPKFLTQFYFGYICMVLATLMLFWFGWKYWKILWLNVSFKRKPCMSTLVGLSTFIAYFFSFYPLVQNTIALLKNDFSEVFNTFFSVVCLIWAIIIIGHVVLDKISLRVKTDFKSLQTLQAPTAFLLNAQGGVNSVPIDQINVGDHIMVHQNGLIPIDGFLLSNQAMINEATISGEAKPVYKNKGDALVGATLNVGAPFRMEVSKKITETFLTQIIQSVQKIHQQKTAYRMFIDKIAVWFIPFVLLCALLTFLLQLVFHNTPWYDRFQTGFVTMIAVLVVACPCMIGLAVPLALMIGWNKASQHSIVIHNQKTYEKIKRIDVVAFDKTGTLTKGSFSVQQTCGLTDDLALLCQLENFSLHPIAKSLAAYGSKLTNKQVQTLVDHLDIEEIPHFGIVATNKQNKDKYRISAFKKIAQSDYDADEQITAFIQTFLKTNHPLESLICLQHNQKIVAGVIISDVLHDNAALTIATLHKQGIKTMLLSGDNQANCAAVAQSLKIDTFLGDLTPQDKAKTIAQLQQKKQKVAFVGDGINDLVALKQADLSIAFDKNNAVADALSDVLVFDSNVFNIYKVIKIAQYTRKVILTNLFFAFAYNIAFLPLAATNVLPLHFAIFGMVLSQIFLVVGNFVFKMKKIRFLPKKAIYESNNKEK